MPENAEKYARVLDIRAERKVVVVAVAIAVAVMMALFFILSALIVRPYSIGTISISSGNSTIRGNVYLATTLRQEETGLMNFTTMGNCYGRGSCIGMLFLFPGAEQLCFWMKNTRMPLRQSWIAANGSVVYVYNAVPESEKSVCYNATAVLETQQNFTIGVGDRVSFLQNG
jgi:uncharacterized membrane protein (UPF0127 family)